MKEKTIQNHLFEHGVVLTSTYNLIPKIINFSEILINALKNNNTIYWCGNGGSNSDAQHLSGELIGRFIDTRKPFKSICLQTGGAEGSCIANDFGYEQIFSRQIEALGNAGDVLICISTSGKSKNVYNAAHVATNKSMHILSMTGSNYSDLHEISKENIIIPSKTTARIQEMHIFIGHILCDLIEQELL